MNEKRDTVKFPAAHANTATWLWEMTTKPFDNELGPYRIKRTSVRAKFSMFCNVRMEETPRAMKDNDLNVIRDLALENHGIIIAEYEDYIYVIPISETSKRTPPRRMMYPERYPDTKGYGTACEGCFHPTCKRRETKPFTGTCDFRVTEAMTKMPVTPETESLHTM